MIEPYISLAFSVHSNKGVYALLLGSGISSAAGIPTGWDIVLDLIRKVGALEGADCEPDPYEWFVKEHGAEPDYSKLLDAIAKTPSERQRLLRGYFEPTDDERAEGLKVPTPAHKAIARLAADGYIRVILTTNFDRLQEQAMEAAGISPIVISTSDAVVGAVPLAHSGVTIIKVNGDYLDTRIKNTVEELSSYDEHMNGLLDRVFDEYGLIVCGWSAEWDIALRSGIERCLSRRYTTFWATRSEPSNVAKGLIRQRSAQIMKITGANEFFGMLSDKIEALSEFDVPHPLSSKMAIATAKRYLADSSAIIKLTDFVREETERVRASLNDTAFPTESTVKTPDELLDRLTRYEALSDVLLSILIAGCSWGSPQHSPLWVKSLTRIAHPPGKQTGFEFLIKMQVYPALYLFYGSGIAAIASERYATLADLINKTAFRASGLEPSPGFLLYPEAVMERNQAMSLPGRDRQYTPLSNHLRERLRSALNEYIPEEQDYDEAFDRFEYLCSLRYWEFTWQDSGYDWAPAGAFVWRSRMRPEFQIANKLNTEVEEQGENWPPLKFGLFQSPLETLKQTKAAFDKFMQRYPWGF